jgi:hypothetical protein
MYTLVDRVEQRQMAVEAPTMKRTVVVLFAAVLGLAAPGWADKLQDDLDKLTAGLPKDVAAVLTRRVACNHWMGEEPYDKARAREIERAIRQNKCDSLAGDEAALRKRYADDPKVTKALDEAQDF